MSDTTTLTPGSMPNAALLGIAVAPEWRDGGAAASAHHARPWRSACWSSPLPDEADPAPVFRA